MEFETNQDKVTNSPIPQDKLIDLIQTSYNSIIAEDHNEQAQSIIDRFLKRILEQLNKHSSLYKYVVSLTTLKTVQESEETHSEGDGSDDNFTMANAVGASWNSKKDGLFNYTVKDEEYPNQQHLVTIIWVSK